MNKHFEDARYYIKRAGETAKKGVAEELEPLQERVQDLIGEEEEPDESRVEQLRTDLQDIQERASGEAKEAIGDAREKLDEIRSKEAE